MGKAVMVIVPVVIIGLIAGLGFSGVINIPGLTPKKAVKNAAAMYAQKDDKTPPAIPATPPAAKTALADPPPTKPKDKIAKPDPELGAEALAAVWNEIKTPELIKISKDWKDKDLAKVLEHMETDNVAKLLDEMAKDDPVRASKLSKVLRDQGSVVAPEPAKTT